jgi:hypothetical protein
MLDQSAWWLRQEEEDERLEEISSEQIRFFLPASLTG